MVCGVACVCFVPCKDVEPDETSSVKVMQGQRPLTEGKIVVIGISANLR